MDEGFWVGGFASFDAGMWMLLGKLENDLVDEVCRQDAQRDWAGAAFHIDKRTQSSLYFGTPSTPLDKALSNVV